MARGTIKQRIALDGGDQIKKEFQDLGKAGEAAFDLLQKAIAASGTPAAKLSGAISKLRGEVGKLADASKRVRADFGNFATSFGDFGRSVGIVARNIGIVTGAVGLAGVALFGLAKSAADAADAADEQAASVGLQIEQFGKLTYAAGLAGVGQEKFIGALTRFNVTLADAGKNGKASVAIFTALGASYKDARGKLLPTEEVLLNVADAFSKLPPGAAKSALAVQLFGKTGAALVPFLDLARDGIVDLGNTAVKQGGIITAAQAKIGSAFADAVDNLNGAVRGTRIQLGLLFAPTFTALADGFTKAINENRQAIIDLTNKGIAVALPLLRDFIFALSGNDAKVENIWILEWRNAIIGFGRDVVAVFSTVIKPVFSAIVAGAQVVADGINEIFGTDITGGQVLLSAALLKLIGVFAVVSSAIGVVVSGLQLLASTFSLVIASVPALLAFWNVLVTGATAFGAAIVALVGWPVLIAAGVVAAGAAIYAFWDEIKAGGKAAFDFVSGLFSAENFTALGIGLASAATSAGQLFIAAWKVQIDLFRAARDAMANLVIASFVDLGNRIASAIQRATGIKVDIANFKDIANRIVEPFRGIPGAITAALAGIGEAITGAFQSALNAVNSIVDSITSAVNRLKSLVSSTSSLQSDYESGSTGGGSGFASGGYVSGPGTGTSDSIVARLSNGEFVVRAEAVRKYGAGLLSAINNMRLSPNALSSLKGFASGGLVQGGGSVDFSGLIDGLTVGMSHRSRMPAYASGGLVEAQRSGGRPINLTIGNETYEFQAREDVAEKLAKHIANGRLKSAGKRPSWG